jgi:hypothetical protein
MSLLLALFLVVHGGVHIGYICGPAWPFVATDPWLVTAIGASPDAVRTVGVALVLVTFFAFLIAAPTAVGILPSRLWAPLVAVGSVASAIVLVMFITPGTIPGLAIDALLLWAVLARKWRPAPLIGRRTQSNRPVTS